MKSSIATTSIDADSFGPSAVLPLVICTRPTRSPALNCTPRKERPLFATGAKNVPSELPVTLKNWIDVVLARSTSVNTAPKALVDDADVEPGTKKLTSRILLPMEAKSRCGLKVWKAAE